MPDSPTVGIPVTMVFTRASPIGTANRGAELFYKSPGLGKDMPRVQGIGEGGIDFSAHALFRSCEGTPIPMGPLPQIDAMSIGQDILTIDSSGKVAVAKNRWAGLLISVTNSSKGKPGSRLAAESATSAIGSDLFHHFFKEGDCICDFYLGKTLESWDQVDAKIPPDSELSGIDIYIAAYAARTASLLKLPAAPSFYFSVPTSDVAMVPAAWWNGKPKSGATIFVQTWNRTTGKWSCPQGLFAPDQIGLEDCEDIDALAYDGKRLVMSTTLATAPCPARNQLLFVDPSADLPAAVAVSNGDGNLSDSAGLDRTDDVDGVCGTDPSCDVLGQGGTPIEYFLCVPECPPFTLPLPLLPSQGYRTVGTSSTSYDFVMLGGRAGGFGVFFVSPPGLWPSVLLQLSAVPIVSSGPGNPVNLSVPIPPVAGLRADFSWIAFTATPPYYLSASQAIRLFGP